MNPGACDQLLRVPSARGRKYIIPPEMANSSVLRRHVNVRRARQARLSALEDVDSAVLLKDGGVRGEGVISRYRKPQ
ncbi:hypothetical protein NDU88_003104 [Pleurodeles waltl]|uniref:Uncharacterized protein n=1 Tax=Pleurodeles waltl TaxID=8319 RepID=A0AAV7TMK0_PLEWA|nr:hypothetical protein NDU88_003104 [Pleurodeles waltl]